MLINKKAIKLLWKISVLSLLGSVISAFFNNNITNWINAFSFALFGSSLISLFCSLINYYVEKKKCIEEIAINLINMDNEAHTKIYYLNKQTIDNIVETIGVCCSYLNIIQNLLLSYKEGLIKKSAEIKLIDDTGMIICQEYLAKLCALGDLIKNEKHYISTHLNQVSKVLNSILENRNIYEKINSLLMQNNSSIKLEIIRDNISVIISKIDLKEEIEKN